jgi:hypothetical protein
MQTGITTQPSRASVREEVTELIFTLDQYDYLAWWTYRQEHIRPRSEAPPRDTTLRWTLGGLIVSLGVAGVTLFLPLQAQLGPEIAAIAVSVVVGLLLLLIYLLTFRPGFLLLFRKAARWRQMRMLKNHAAALEWEGQAINPARIHWFLMAPGWFAEVSKLRRRQDGFALYEHRETLADWSAVDEIVVLERHLLIVSHTAGTWIIPTRCFRDDQDRDRFVVTARGYHQAAVRAPVTSITTPPEHAEGLRDER